MVAEAKFLKIPEFQGGSTITSTVKFQCGLQILQNSGTKKSQFLKNHDFGTFFDVNENRIF